MLAVAANIQSPASLPAPPALLHTPGPYNPGATVSTTVAAKILSLKFIEMSEVGADDLNPTGRPAPPRLPVSDISVWVEKFSTMAAIMVQRFPEKAPELFAYQALIVRCERNYRASQWIAYDRAFRREALAAHDLNWSLPNPRLFQEAFTGRARDIPRCNLCLNDDHTTESCPTNPQRAFGYLPPPSSNPPPPPPSYWGRAAQPPRDSRRQSQELCHRWNNGLCRVADSRCRFTHACRECRGSHRAINCPRANPHNGRDRSPGPRPQGPGYRRY